MINSIYIDVEELILELDRAAESPKVAQDWAARFRDTLIYGGRKKNPLPFGMYCITFSKGFAANGKLGRWKSIAKGILNKRDNNDNPTEEEIVAEIVAQNGREEYEKVLADIKAAKNAKNLSADATTREGSQNESDGSDAANLEFRPSADTLPTANEVTKKHPHGEFNNVMLTTDEYTKWIMSGSDADALLEELSSYLASSGKKYKNHYATLLNWRRRKSKEKKDAPKSFAQQDAERREYQLTHSILDKVAL